ncbi:hypothetical protein BDN70DRAFT_4192 [Pholiota conissans]|uniref:Uncharacterized protein n=1 Tax=Pholiota conissans TaxID=109636 RepID=A0A9P5ZEQ3_9AGAR|nr:hypothetical protein BDN70DRAFT_4192 [Pholiota conissans]
MTVDRSEIAVVPSGLVHAHHRIELKCLSFQQVVVKSPSIFGKVLERSYTHSQPSFLKISAPSELNYVRILGPCPTSLRSPTTGYWNLLLNTAALFMIIHWRFGPNRGEKQREVHRPDIMVVSTQIQNQGQTAARRNHRRAIPSRHHLQMPTNRWMWFIFDKSVVRMLSFLASVGLPASTTHR